MHQLEPKPKQASLGMGDFGFCELGLASVADMWNLSWAGQGWASPSFKQASLGWGDLVYS